MASPTSSHYAIYLRNVSLLFLLLLPAAGLGTRLGLWSVKPGLLLWLIAVAGSVIIALLVLVGWWYRSPGDSRQPLMLAALCALPGLVTGAGVLSHLGNPAAATIHQVTTDPRDPPAFVAAVNRRGEHSNPLAYSDDVAAIQARAYPDLTTLHSALEPAAAFQRCLAVAESLGWEVYAAQPAQGRIEAVDTTFWFGFRDDIALRIKAAPAGGSLIDLRSVSRVGGGDMGTNAKRIHRFINAYNDRR